MKVGIKMKDLILKVVAPVMAAAIVGGVGALWKIKEQLGQTNERIARIEAILSVKQSYRDASVRHDLPANPPSPF
jgi:hypothetical protein